MRESGNSGMNLNLFIYRWARMAKRLHFWHTSVFLWRKKKKKCCHTLELHIWFALRKLCSQLLCASGSFGESLPGECEKSCLFSLSLCASICQLKFKWLAWEWEKRKANLESKKKKKSWQSASWSLEVVNSAVRGEERYGVERERVVNHNSTKGLKADACWTTLYCDT